LQTAVDTTGKGGSLILYHGKKVRRVKLTEDGRATELERKTDALGR